MVAVGPELLMLAEHFPEHAIVGIDLAEGMVDRANQLCREAGARQVPISQLGSVGSQHYM